MDQSKKLDKIRKCLRLAKSSSPNEAATAMRQAQALMRELGLSEDDITDEPVTGEVLITKEAFGGCAYLASLSHLMQTTFGVSAVWEPGNGISRVRANVRYIGPQSRVLLAIYAHRVIDRAVDKAWREIRDAFDQKIGARQQFRLGFLLAIKEKVATLAPTASEAKAIDTYKAGRYRNLVKGKNKLTGGDPLAGALGIDAGSKFNIHKPMHGGREQKVLE